MRTTVDLEEDVLRELKDRAHRQQISLKDVLNGVVRCGLDQTTRVRRSTRYVCPTFAMGQTVSPMVNLDKALALADAMEEGEVVRELEMRK